MWQVPELEKKPTSERDREKQPPRQGCRAPSLPDSHAGKPGGRMDSEPLKTRARQPGFVTDPVSMLRQLLICKSILF